jgi:hypothetical protein
MAGANLMVMKADEGQRKEALGANSFSWALSIIWPVRTEAQIKEEVEEESRQGSIRQYEQHRNR